MKTYYYIFYFLFILIFPFQTTSQEVISLENWTITVKNKTHKTKPVCWENSAAKGGPGLLNYDGFAQYNSKVIIPSSMKGKAIAFFTYLIDDADKTYFNGTLIGETGEFPVSEDNISNFQSGVREPRCYVIPESIIKYNKENIITVDVYDYSGNGGFTGNKPPAIGYHSLLEKKKNLLLNLNNLPRISVMSIQLAIMFAFLMLLYNKLNLNSFSNILKKLISLFKISDILKGNIKVKLSVDDELYFKYILVILINICYFIGLLSEVPLKYFIIKSEVFWFKAPAFCIFLGFYLVSGD